MMILQQGTRVTLVEHATLHNRLNKHSMGGSSSNRYQNIRQNQLDVWIKKICERLTHHLVDEAHHRLAVAGIFLGYVGIDMPTRVLASSWLHPLVGAALKAPGRLHVVQDLVLSQLQAQCNAVTQVERDHDVALADEVTTLLSVEHLERCIYGPDELRAAIEAAALKTLYIVADGVAWLDAPLLELAVTMGCTIKRFRATSSSSSASDTLQNSFGGALGEQWFAVSSSDM